MEQGAVAAVCIFCFSTSSLHHSLINFLQNMIHVFCTLLRRDLPLPELLYTIYKLLLVVRFYLWLEVELEFTPQGFMGLRSGFFRGITPPIELFSLKRACARLHVGNIRSIVFFFCKYILTIWNKQFSRIVSEISIYYELNFLVQFLD